LRDVVVHNGGGAEAKLAILYRNADLYRQRYGLSWKQFIEDEPPEIFEIVKHIMNSEAAKSDLDGKRQSRDSSL
jgi:hypothetical protein